jgi:beta-glucosidase
LRVMYKTNMINAQRTPSAHSTAEHAEVAKKVAEEGIILLRNKNNVLPLSKTGLKNIAVIGANASRKNAMGGGSSQVRPRYEITPLEGIRACVSNASGITFAQGYTVAKKAKADDKLIQEAVEAAKKSEVAIVFGGWAHGFNYSIWSDNAYDAEGIDKPDMNMPFGQDELISAVIDANPNTIVVLFGGGPLNISKWEGKAKAILQVGYPGQEGGHAISEILFGDVNPSGKLTFSWPKTLEDSPAHKTGEYPGDSLTVRYKEDIFVGYRYFDTYKVQPQFAFGHGLSYSTFEYKNLRLAKTGNEVTATFTLTNTGAKAGAEVVQLYVKDSKASVKRPEKELKGFEKVFLNAGESKEITIELKADAFKFFDEKSSQWKLESGKFEIQAGTSSADIRLKKSITL